MNLGGISVGGIVGNRKFFGSLLTGVDHLPHTLLPAKTPSPGAAGSWGGLADELEPLVALHDASTIAAVIVEPVAGSTGVLIPPKGYLQRLRDMCTRHGILLIFDEVITGFGRTGAAFGADKYGVVPDLITCAKGLTNGVIPMGAVLATGAIHDAFMTGPEHLIELFHGYTYRRTSCRSRAGGGDRRAKRWRSYSCSAASSRARCALCSATASRKVMCTGSDAPRKRSTANRRERPRGSSRC